MNNPFAPQGANYVTLYPKQKAWSFSVCNNHALCPKKIKFAKIDRIPDSNAAMDRGQTIHKAAGALIDHDVDQGLLHPDWVAKVRELRARNAKSEKQLAFTKDWVPCEWYGAHVWGRIVLDAHYLMLPRIVQVVEFKTGKAYPDHTTQLRLYALAGFILYPDAEEVRAENWYFDQPCRGAVPGYVAKVSALPRLKEEFYNFAQPLLNDDIYPATPGNHCGWCAFSKRKGGPCEF